MDWVVGIILDIILVLIVFLFARKGKKDGFAKTLVGFLGFFVAVILAVTLCKPVSNFVYSSFLQKPVETAIQTTISEQVEGVPQKYLNGNAIVSQLEKTLEDAPSFIKKAINVEEKRQEYSEKLNQITNNNATQISQKVTETIVKPPLIAVLSGVVFVVLFLVLMLICKIITKALGLVNKLPLLGEINALLGGFVGVLEGIIVVLIINVLITLLVGESGSLFSIITPQTIQSSLIMKKLAEINPLNVVFKQMLNI